MICHNLSRKKFLKQNNKQVKERETNSLVITLFGLEDRGQRY